MSTGKNASYRYRLIDQALRNKGRRWYYLDLIQHVSEKLAEEFDIEKGISQRQFDDDLRIMRKDPPQGYGAPIIRQGGEIYYEDPNFSINDNPLNETDIESLKEVLRLIKPFQSLPQLRELETILGKVQGTISQSTGEQIIELEHNPNAKGLVHLEGLYPLIKDGREILVSYKPFNWIEEIEYLIHPFLIKEYNNRWFLLGWNPNEKKFTVLGLDRILKFKETGNGIIKSKQKELAQLRQNIIGVSFMEGAKPVEVKLWVSAAQVPYLITKPLHLSQKLIEEQADGSILSFKLVPNFELEQMILMYGERVKVIVPMELADRIKERIRKSLEQYND
jgi:predicted DNA-binding transcriptional regulator YafY